MKVLVRDLKSNVIKLELKREELIYGVTAVLTNQTEEKYVIHPLTNEKLPVIYSDENRFFIPAHIEEDYDYAKKNGLEIRQVVAPYFKGEDEETVKENVKTQFRHSVIAVIKHNKEDKYLCVDCKNRECKSFVLGGVEDNETAEEVAIREVREETGYTDVVIEKKRDISIYNHFYAGYKGVNRYTILDILFGKITSENHEVLCEEESAKHVVKWIPREELATFLNIQNNIYVLSELENGEKAYTDEQGKMINSAELDRLDVIEARNIIKERLDNLNM